MSSLPPAPQLRIGSQLQAAREQRGMTLEDAAHYTKIPYQRLLWLEKDNFAAFGCFTYARSFLKKYSAFLEVDAHDLLECLPQARLAGESDYRHLSSSQGLWPSKTVTRRIPVRQTTAKITSLKQPVLVASIMFALLFTGTVFWGYHLGTRPAQQPPSKTAPQTVTAMAQIHHSLAESAGNWNQSAGSLE